MNKLLLKRLLLESLEQLARLDVQIAMLELSTRSNVMPYVKGLKNALAQTREQVWSNQDAIRQLSDDAPLQDSLISTLTEDLLPSLQRETAAIAQSLFRIGRMDIFPETELFLNSLNLDKLLPGAPELVVLPSANRTLSAAEADESGLLLKTDVMLLENLSIQALGSPLHWVTLMDGFTRYFSRKTLQISALLEEMVLPEPQLDVIGPLLSLRLLGPAYYASYVLNALAQHDSLAIWMVEPAMFQGLNRFGLINKDLVILHQNIERVRQQGALEKSVIEKSVIEKSVIEKPAKLTSSQLSGDTAEMLLVLVERVVPERLAYTEKSFNRSQILEDRLSNGMLISAAPMGGSISQLRSDLDELESEAPIYPLLQQLREVPASPREIINAGWLMKLDATAGWIENLFEAPVPEEAWELWKQTVMELDTLLLKSIEISEVHRVLSLEESDYLLSV